MKIISSALRLHQWTRATQQWVSYKNVILETKQMINRAAHNIIFSMKEKSAALCDKSWDIGGEKCEFELKETAKQCVSKRARERRRRKRKEAQHNRNLIDCFYQPTSTINDKWISLLNHPERVGKIFSFTSERIVESRRALCSCFKLKATTRDGGDSWEKKERKLG
jgi:hypothetical protein